MTFGDLVGLFEIAGVVLAIFLGGGAAVSRKSKDSVVAFLDKSRAQTKNNDWAIAFNNFFESIYGDTMWSWKRISRSAITSLVITAILFTPLYHLFKLRLEEILFFVLFSSVFNVAIDFLSLAETKWILNRISKSKKSFGHIGYLLLDIVFTNSLIIVGLVISIGIVLFITQEQIELELLSRTSERVLVIYTDSLQYYKLGNTPIAEINYIVGPYVYSSFVTSIWIYLFILSSFLIKSFNTVRTLSNKAISAFDYKYKPFVALGTVSAILVITIGTLLHLIF